MIFKIKIIIGIILPIFLFLPLGSCERKQVIELMEPSDAPIQKPEFMNEIKGAEYLILIETVSKAELQTWLSLFIFIWPLPFLVIKKYAAKTKWREMVANIFELLLIGFSIYCIYSIVFFFWYTPTICGYLAATTITLYALAFLVEIFAPFYQMKLRKT